MATNGLFRMKLEMASNGDPAPFTANEKFTADASHLYSTASWDIAVHEVTWNVNPTFIENADELRGLQSMPWHDGAGSMSVELTAKARVRPRMLGLLCYMVTGGTVTDVIGSTTTVGHKGVAVGTGAFQHQYSWTSSDIPRTATIRFAPTKGEGFIVSGAALSTLAFSFEESGAMIADMTFRGLYFSKAAVDMDGAATWWDLTLTGAGLGYETAVPLKKSNFTFAGQDDDPDAPNTDSIFSATDSKATDFNFTIENNISNFFSFGANSIWPDAIEYEDLWARVSGSVTKRQVKAADYDRWVGAGVDNHFTECIQGEGAPLSGTTGPKFSFFIHLPAAQWMAMNPEAITNKRRIGVTFDWEARTDSPETPGSSNWCDLYVINAEAASVYTAHGA